MKNIKIYWDKRVMREDGNYYDLLTLETKNDIMILFEIRSKV